MNSVSPQLCEPPNFSRRLETKLLPSPPRVLRLKVGDRRGTNGQLTRRRLRCLQTMNVRAIKLNNKFSRLWQPLSPLKNFGYEVKKFNLRLPLAFAKNKSCWAEVDLSHRLPS